MSSILPKTLSYRRRGTPNRMSGHLARCMLFRADICALVRQIYIVDINGKSTPKELTSGKQGATHNPVFNTAGDKVAWIELDQDGHESDR